MDQVHTRALEALQPFVHLANSSNSPTPRFVVNLITNATSSPNTYVFAELLETQAVQALGSPENSEEHRSYLRLLELFAWGTWEEYHCEFCSVPVFPPFLFAQCVLELLIKANPWGNILTAQQFPIYPL